MIGTSGMRWILACRVLESRHAEYSRVVLKMVSEYPRVPVLGPLGSGYLPVDCAVLFMFSTQ